MTDIEAASMSSSSSNHPWKYHVFLSFRGEDTRNNFTGHLCSALRQKGINTFMDDELERGEDISTSLLQTIEESRISIIVFSKNYASSKWCLDELVKILECKKLNQQDVRPVFYRVNPSDIRNHRGSFGEALANHERNVKDNMEKVQIWKVALKEAANLLGWPLLNEHSESKCIHDIVEEISEQVITHTYLNVAKYPVGIKPRVQDINKLLRVRGRDVCMVGIWGTGGIGKTTIAKAVYNSIAHKFEGRCFLESVRENSMCCGGLVKQQETLLFEILGRKKLKVTNAAIGITTIKERLRYKSVLLVLDDVNNLNQLNNLAGGLDWFGKGSRIIITTRDKRLLVAHDIDLMYNVKKLDYHEAVELFSWSAFKRKGPLEVYAELTERAIGYAQGLPLALRVLGSYLYGGNLDTWKATLDGFKSPEIQQILKVSYDALVDSAKEVFLDIACFFNGRKKKHVIKMLEGCGLNPDHGVNVLIEMALININEFGVIRMHDLVEEMGKDIIHQESPNDPGKRSRLWFHDDVYDVLTENTGTAKITGIKVELPEDSDVICLSGTTFLKMRNLRLFIHRAGCFSGALDYLPSSLRVVDWPNCPFQSLPSNFNPRKLAVLKMPKSRITGVMEGFKNLRNLTSINLSSCRHLTKVADLSEIPNLQIFDLSRSSNLVEIHPSVGFLDKLSKFNLLCCYSLIIFPTRVSWKSMRELQLQQCRSLENFVEIVDKMDCLWRLNLSWTGIKQLPSWIGYLTSLRELVLSSTPIEELPSFIGNLVELEYLHLGTCINLRNLPQSIYKLRSLLYLSLSGCPNLVVFPTKARFEVPLIEESLPVMRPANSNISRDNHGSLQLFPRVTNLQFEGCNLLSVYEFLASLDCLYHLHRLNLSGSNLVSLPVCISKFIWLRNLNLNGCKSLREILELPPYIEDIDVGGCVSLEKFPTVSRMLEFNDLRCLNSMDLSYCHRLLIDNKGFDVVSNMADAVQLNEVVSKMAKALVLKKVFKESEFEAILPGSEIPKWFDCRKDEDCVLMPDCTSELWIEIPRSLKWKETGFVVCAVFEGYSVELNFSLDITINEVYMTVREEDINESSVPTMCYFLTTVTEPSAHVWLKYIPLKVDIKQEVDRKSDPWMPYLCRLKFSYLPGDAFLFKSCGVHLVNVPCDDDVDDGYDYDDNDDDDDEDEVLGDEDDVSSDDSSEKIYRKRHVSMSELGFSSDFDKAESATLSTSSSSGGIGAKRGVEHSDHDGEPGPTKRFKQITHGAEPKTSGSALD
ncbi:TMV resistance protein N-like [Rosa chinensis]|uniref:TMV resistance protein N-like n=1 Tax=Rosa chinensis TaxID=74649 RepID=UPI001AD8C28B|nr:TMV resistance protein N-like [Rosa chinensis]